MTGTQLAEELQLTDKENTPSSESRPTISHSLLKSVTDHPALVALLLPLVLLLPGIFAFEFFRHTEADRALIAWEMLERGELIVPHLLGSEILTKPPLFYWLIAGSMQLFETNSEWVARAPSLCLGLLLTFSLFHFVQADAKNKSLAILATTILATSPLFLQLYSSAEIDGCFSTLLVIALFLIYQGIEQKSLFRLICAYFFVGLALLTKGPTALCFALGIHTLWSLLRRPFSMRELGALVLQTSLLSVLAVSIFALWFYPAGLTLGFSRLFDATLFEISRRFSGVNAHDHGPFFYLSSLAVGFAPWSIVLGAGLYFRPRGERITIEPLIGFSLLTIIVTLTGLSLAAGKSSRYSLWLYPFFAILCAKIFYLCPEHLKVKNLSVSKNSALSFLVLIAFVSKVGELSIFAPYRNSTRSVRQSAAETNALLPEGEVIYILELKERWINYYLKRLGRESIRLTEQKLKNLIGMEKDIALLVSNRSERAVLETLHRANQPYQVIGSFNQKRSEALLIRVSPQSLSVIPLSAEFNALPSGS